MKECILWWWLFRNSIMLAIWLCLLINIFFVGWHSKLSYVSQQKICWFVPTDRSVEPFCFMYWTTAKFQNNLRSHSAFLFLYRHVAIFQNPSCLLYGQSPSYPFGFDWRLKGLTLVNSAALNCAGKMAYRKSQRLKFDCLINTKRWNFCPMWTAVKYAAKL